MSSYRFGTYHGTDRFVSYYHSGSQVVCESKFMDWRIVDG